MTPTMTKAFPAFLCVLLALSGCAWVDSTVSGANNYIAGEIKTTQKNVQATNDNAATIWVDSGCAIPYGEVVRNGTGNPNMPAAVITLCGAPAGFTMIHSTPTATATTSIPTNTIQVPTATPSPQTVPAAPIPTGPTPSSSAAPAVSNKSTAQASQSALAAKIAALMQQH